MFRDTHNATIPVANTAPVNKNVYPRALIFYLFKARVAGKCFDVSLFCIPSRNGNCLKRKPCSVPSINTLPFMFMDFYGKEFMLSLCSAISFFVYVSCVAIWLNKHTGEAEIPKNNINKADARKKMLRERFECAEVGRKILIHNISSG